MSGIIPRTRAYVAKATEQVARRPTVQHARVRWTRTKDKSREWSRRLMQSQAYKDTSFSWQQMGKSHDWTVSGLAKQFKGFLFGQPVSGKAVAGTDTGADTVAQFTMQKGKVNYIAEGRTSMLDALDSMGIKAQRAFGKLAVAPKVDFLRGWFELEGETAVANHLPVNASFNIHEMLTRVDTLVQQHGMKADAWKASGGGAAMMEQIQQGGPGTSRTVTLGRKEGISLLNKTAEMSLRLRLSKTGEWEIRLRCKGIKYGNMLLPGIPFKAIFNGSESRTLILHTKDGTKAAAFMDEVMSGRLNPSNPEAIASFRVGHKHARSRDMEGGVRLPFGSMLECSWVGRLPLVLKMKSAARSSERLPGDLGVVSAWIKTGDLTTHHSMVKNSSGQITGARIKARADVSDNFWQRVMWGELGSVSMKAKRLHALKELSGNLPEALMSLQTTKSDGLFAEATFQMRPDAVKELAKLNSQAEQEKFVEDMQNYDLSGGEFFQHTSEIMTGWAEIFEDLDSSPDVNGQKAQHIDFWSLQQTQTKIEL